MENDFWHTKWFKRVLGVVVLVVVFLLGMWISRPVSFNGFVEEMAYSSRSQSASIKSMDYAMEYEMEYDYDEGAMLSAVPAADGGDLDSETRIIKTGSLTVDVKNTEETMATIADFADQFEGFIQYSNTWLQSDETTAGSVTLRIKADYFEEALEAIKGLATVVQSESVSGEDVTEQYIDLQARLSNYEAEEAQYLEILERATTVEELLMVSDYLAYVREDIEMIQGQLNYLEDRTDFSTISVYVYEEASILAPTSDWQPLVQVKKAFNKLVVTGQGFVNGVIWLVVFGVPLLIVIWIGRKIFSAIRKNRK